MTTTKSRPLVCSQEEVRAILEGKTETRRLIFKDDLEHHMPWFVSGKHWQDGDDHLRCPFGKPGDSLWVKEGYDAFDDPAAKKSEIKRKVWNEEECETERWVVDYRADGNHRRIKDKIGTRVWSRAITMPRWASRITLTITSVRVERDDAGWWWVVGHDVEVKR